jgi:hypothetical protein
MLQVVGSDLFVSATSSSPFFLILGIWPNSIIVKILQVAFSSSSDIPGLIIRVINQIPQPEFSVFPEDIFVFIFSLILIKDTKFWPGTYLSI